MAIVFILNNIFWMVFVITFFPTLKGEKPALPVVAQIQDAIEDKVKEDKKKRDPLNPLNISELSNISVRPSDILKGRMKE